MEPVPLPNDIFCSGFIDISSVIFESEHGGICNYAILFKKKKMAFSDVYLSSMC